MLRILQGKGTSVTGHYLGFQPGPDPLGPFCCLSESSDLRLSRGGPELLAVRFRWMERLCLSGSIAQKAEFSFCIAKIAQQDALLEIHIN